MTKKIRPESCDFVAIERSHGVLKSDATEAQIAERYRLVQAHALGRLCQEEGILDANWKLKT